jgi:hypothetical protein
MRFLAAHDRRADRWSDNAGDLLAQAGQRIGAGKRLARHDLGNCGRVGRLKERPYEAEDGAGDVDVPDLELLVEGQQGDDRHDAAAQQIGYQHDAQPWEAIDRDAAEQQKDQHGSEGEDQHAAHRRRGAGLLQHPPGQRNRVQAVAKARDHLAAPEQGEGSVLE